MRTPPTTQPDRVLRTALRSVWIDGRRVERACYVIGAALLASGLFHLGVILVADGSWQGPVSWRKPITFGLSFGLTVITLTWVTSYVRLGARVRAGLLGVFAAASVAEVALITLQAWRRVPSHFNFETAFDTVVTRMLAAGGAVIVAVITVLVVGSLRRQPDTAPSMRLAVRVGLATLEVALLIGAVMIARGVVEVVTGSQQAAYAVGSTLKPGHAVTMHGVLVLPALAWLLSLTTCGEQRRIRVVGLGVAGYVLLAGVVVAESFAGVSPLAAPLAATALSVLGGLTLLAAGAIAAAAFIQSPRG